MNVVKVLVLFLAMFGHEMLYSQIKIMYGPYLQNLYDSEVREFKGLGRGFLDFFKQLYKGKEIDLHSVFSARDFYFKNGFHPVERDSNNLYFIA